MARFTHMWQDPRDPRQDPETEKKLRSGFWRREASFETGEVRWILDLFKLEDAVRELISGRHRDVFHQNPEHCLDMLYGEGTGRAYFTQRRHHGDRYINYHEPRFGMPPCPTPPSPKTPSEKPYRSLVRTMPLQVSWINGQCSLTSQLEQEFKAWAGSQLSDVQRWSREPLSSKQLTINSTP